MAKIPAKAIEEYRKLLQKDPNSKVFAPLAEALRETGELQQAETVAANGIQRHPQYVGGYVSLGRILMDQGRFKEALPILQKASQLDAENLLALHLLGTLHLQVSQPKDALKAFKRILFLNPQSEKARNAVQKLESISADEYEEDLFQYQTLRDTDEDQHDLSAEPRPHQVVKRAENKTNFSPLSNRISTSKSGARPSETPQKLMPSNPISGNEIDRRLSLVDALIVRNDLEKARAALMELHTRVPGNPEIAKRFELLDEYAPEEEATPIQPLQAREKTVFERKKNLLENLLRRIKAHHEGSFTDSSNG